MSCQQHFENTYSINAKTPQNGVGHFLLPCRSLTFHYCNWWGSSRGMNAFLKTSLPAFARANPQIEISVSPRPRRHPVVVARYLNGKTKSTCVKNLQSEGVRDKARLLRDATGEKDRKIGRMVESRNESVRGIWDPFHGAKVKI
jgi:large subunit ribosomal protein L43